MMDPPNDALNQWEDIPLAFHFHKCCMFYICLMDDSSRIASSFFLDYEYDCHFPFSYPSF
jgi:hypothetical protein